MNWPAGEVDTLAIVGNVWDAYNAFRNHSGKTPFGKAQPAAWEIVTNIFNMRKAAGLNWATGV